MAPYIRATTARSYGWSIETGTESVSGNQRSQTTGRRRSENFASGSSPGTTGFLRSSGKERNYNSRIGWTFFWRTIPDHRSGQKKPTKRTSARPRISRRRFASEPVGDITADDIEHYLRRRLQTRVQFKTAEGVIQKGPAQAGDSPSGTAGSSAYAERRSSQAAPPCEPVFGGGVPGEGEGNVPATLYVMVGATAHRVPGTRLPAQHYSDHQ